MPRVLTRKCPRYSTTVQSVRTCNTLLSPPSILTRRMLLIPAHGERRKSPIKSPPTFHANLPTCLPTYPLSCQPSNLAAVTHALVRERRRRSGDRWGGNPGKWCVLLRCVNYRRSGACEGRWMGWLVGRGGLDGLARGVDELGRGSWEEIWRDMSLGLVYLQSCFRGGKGRYLGSPMNL